MDPATLQNTMILPSLFLSIVAQAHAAIIQHYPPTQTSLNNLTFVINGTGAPGIFNTSHTPQNVDYGEYNWCSMPHVRAKEYRSPPKEYTLEYVEVIQRHHKRTPYASNTFPTEDISWSCTGEGPTYGAGGSDVPKAQWQAYIDPANPWSSAVQPGFINSTCQFPQLTQDGLEDSTQHGSDLRAVYFSRLKIGKYDPSTFQIRVTNNALTSQVASGILSGLFPALSSRSPSPAVLIQPPTLDSLEPTYPCPAADTLRNAYTTGSDAWLKHLGEAKSLFGRLDAISGLQGVDGWHVSFDHYYDNMSAKQCHGKTLPCSVNDTSLCVSQDDADTVYRLGNYEYSYIYRDAPDSAKYAALKYGAWMLELSDHIKKSIDGSNKVKYFHNIAHDGSMAPLLGFLQVSEMVWPGMGSEVVFELYRQQTQHFIRVLWNGQPMETSTPLGTLDMIRIEDFLAYINSMVASADDLLAACNGSS